MIEVGPPDTFIVDGNGVALPKMRISIGAGLQNSGVGSWSVFGEAAVLIGDIPTPAGTPTVCTTGPLLAAF